VRLLLQVVTAAAILLQADNLAQISLGQSLDLLLHADLPPLQDIAPGLQILRQPMPAMRPLQGIADGLWMGQQLAQILPDQALNPLGRNKARAALRLAIGMEGRQLAATAIVPMLRPQAAAEAG
jgi:hypothetical protein